MHNEPTPDELAALSRLYATEHISLDDKLMRMHFSLAGSDWYVAEYDPNQHVFFGYTIPAGDLYNAEWGPISYDALKAARTPQGREVARDPHWQPRTPPQIDTIREAYRVQGYWP